MSPLYIAVAVHLFIPARSFYLSAVLPVLIYQPPVSVRYRLLLFIMSTLCSAPCITVQYRFRTPFAFRIPPSRHSYCPMSPQKLSRPINDPQGNSKPPPLCIYVIYIPVHSNTFGTVLITGAARNQRWRFRFSATSPPSPAPAA